MTISNDEICRYFQGVQVSDTKKPLIYTVEQACSKLADDQRCIRVGLGQITGEDQVSNLLDLVIFEQDVVKVERSGLGV